MRVNLFKLWVLGFLVLSSFSLSLAYASQYATIIIHNRLPVTYSIVNYTKTGGCFFSGEPNQVPARTSQFYGYQTFTGDFDSTCANNPIGFELRDPNNPNCVNDPQQHLGHCYDVYINYSPTQAFPNVNIYDNSQPCSRNCSAAQNSDNSETVTVTITTSSQ